MKREKATIQPFVVIDVKKNQYQRYIGRQRTDHVKTDIPLDRLAIEQFRTDPASMYDDDDDEGGDHA